MDKKIKVNVKGKKVEVFNPYKSTKELLKALKRAFNTNLVFIIG